MAQIRGSQKKLHHSAIIFNENQYFALGFNIDQKIQDHCDYDCDIHDMSKIIQSSSIGSIICLSVIEHVYEPIKVIDEIYRVLIDGGVLILSTPFFISYHGKSNFDMHVMKTDNDTRIDSSHTGYGDFQRFTHEGLWLLLRNAGFSSVEIYPVDGKLISRLKILGLFDYLKYIPGFVKILSYFDRPTLGRMTTMHFLKAVK